VGYNGTKWEEVVNVRNMLIGEYTHNIDEKNRLSLPVKFRKEMGKTVVVAPGLEKSLFVFTAAEWKKKAEQLAEGSMLQSDTRSFSRYFLGGATEVAVDANGRILLPDFLKDRAGIKEKVAIIGVYSRLELWDEPTWQKYKRQVEANADSLAERLGSIGVL
jgi:MraZ protein